MLFICPPFPLRLGGLRGWGGGRGCVPGGAGDMEAAGMGRRAPPMLVARHAGRPHASWTALSLCRTHAWHPHRHDCARRCCALHRRAPQIAPHDHDEGSPHNIQAHNSPCRRPFWPGLWAGGSPPAARASGAPSSTPPNSTGASGASGGHNLHPISHLVKWQQSPSPRRGALHRPRPSVWCPAC